jgi:DNA-binding transcriptional regulator YiaG
MQPMSPPITKKILRDRLGIKTDADLAGYFQITRAAIAQWGEDDPVPELRLFQAIKRNPSAFPEYMGGVAMVHETTEPLARVG